MIDKEHAAMFRAAIEVAGERTRNHIEELADKLRPSPIDLNIPSPNISNVIDMKPVAEVISAMLSVVRDNLTTAGKIDMTPIAEAISSAMSLSENRPVPQVNVDMTPVSAALGDGMQSMVDMIEVQNKKIGVLSDALTKLLEVLVDQKPVQPQKQVVVESPSIIALVTEQREFFAKMLESITDKPKRQIRISHGETESVVTEV